MRASAASERAKILAFLHRKYGIFFDIRLVNASNSPHYDMVTRLIVNSNTDNFEDLIKPINSWELIPFCDFS